MKTFQNPTTYFFEQANNPSEEFKDKIDDFVKKLINLETCILCKEQFNFSERMPRILIHCGHTYCTTCLKNFYKNQRVRCPLCLKLVKNIESLDRIPVNHTIFTKMAEKLNQQNKINGQQEIDIPAALYAQFEASLQPKQQEMYPQNATNGKRIDPETGLEWCEYHYDRISHFFCMTHQQTCCRVCTEVLHNREPCSIIDLYEIEDRDGFLENFNNVISLQQQQEGHIDPEDAPSIHRHEETEKQRKIQEQQDQKEKKKKKDLNLLAKSISQINRECDEIDNQTKEQIQQDDSENDDGEEYDEEEVDDEEIDDDGEEEEEEDDDDEDDNSNHSV